MYESYRLEFLRVWKTDRGAELQFEPFDQPAPVGDTLAA
jgi:hypothetical protein